MKIILESDKSTGWEDKVNRATVIFKDGKYHMWYTGQTNDTSKIGYAVSVDGYSFKKFDNPVLVPEYEYEKNAVMNPCVLYDEKEKIFKMWYSAGEIYEPDVIGYAMSTDGIHWEKCKNPIFEKNPDKNALDSYKIGGCDIHKINDNEYIMFYIGYTDVHTARVFIAKSNNRY